MTSFISRKAKVLGKVLQDSAILGGSIIGDGSFIDRFVYVGYPRRGKLTAMKSMDFNDLDELSSGARIGSRCIIRSHTIIYEDVELGDGVETGHGVLIREGSRVGSGSRIGSFSQLDGCVEVGSGVSIQSNVYLPHLTKIGDRVFIGPGVIVTNDPYPVSGRLIGVRICDEAVVGAGAILKAGVEIGRRAVVGAGAVVTRDVPEDSVVVGSPARVRMTRSEYEEKKRRYEIGR